MSEIVNTEKVKRHPVDVVVFVKTWANYKGNLSQVSQELKRSKQQVMNRYKKLTSLGVKLCEPVYDKSNRRKLESRVEELNKLLSEIV